jgi:hypothetical protein
MNFYYQGKMIRLENFKEMDSKLWLENAKEAYSSFYFLINRINSASFILESIPNYGFSYYRTFTRVFSTECNRFIEVEEIANLDNYLISDEDFIKFIDLVLEVIGFKEIIKDYIIVGGVNLVSYGMQGSSEVRTVEEADSRGLFRKYISYKFDVLFPKPNVTTFNDLDLKNNRFNLSFFDEQKEKDKTFYLNIEKLTSFLMQYLQDLFLNIGDRENFKKNYLNILYLKKIELNFEDNLINDILHKDTGNMVYHWLKLRSRELPLTKESLYFLGFTQGFDFTLEKYFNEKEIAVGLHLTYEEYRKSNLPPFNYRKLWSQRSWLYFFGSWESFLFSKKYKIDNIFFKVKGFGIYENVLNYLE